jgi:malate dehydrogenase (oxaloacetate-decarboxylating)(NADP+)
MIGQRPCTAGRRLGTHSSVGKTRQAKEENVMGNATDDADTSAVQSTQGQSKTCKQTGCSTAASAEPAAKKGKASHGPKGGKKDLMVRLPLGVAILRDPAFNKGTAFTEEERDVLGIRGLLPPRVSTIERQLVRVLGNVRRKATNLEKYIFLTSLQDRNMTLFYRALVEHIEELMPIVYTPTVGEACLEYSNILRRPHGVFITANDKGRIAQILRNARTQDVRIIVVTDGERILGLGDIGADGMGIPSGKLDLYTACGGIHPFQGLPVTIDVGTENEGLLNDPLYIGLKQRRLRGAAYDELLHEFVTAVQDIFPRALIQFEDFANKNAFALLERYRYKVCCFNDDIQGTAAVTLAGLYAAARVAGTKLKEHKFLFLGAGEAGLGTGNLVVSAMVEEGLTDSEARQRCSFVDSKGLVVASRDDLNERKLPYAHEHEFLSDFLACVESVKPTAIIGVSGKPRMFTREVLEAMARINDRPIIFSLSNPTSKTECTAAEAYTWTEGRAIFASGSPFDSVTVHGKTFIPAQGNNVYIFPGVGLGVLATGAKYVTDEMFLAAARTLAQHVSYADVWQGRVYPPLTSIRQVSLAIAIEVMEVAYKQGLAQVPRPDDLEAYLQSVMYYPNYHRFV